MGIGTAIYFEKDVEEEIIRTWHNIEELGFTSPMKIDGQRPHISLISCDEDAHEAEVLLQKLQALHLNFSGCRVSIEAVSAFMGSEYAVFYAVAASRWLVRLHDDVYHLAMNLGIHVSEYYGLDRWLPHCSLAGEIPQSRLGEFMENVQFSQLPISCDVSALVVAHWEEDRLIEAGRIHNIT